MANEAPLSREDALILLDDFQAILPRLASGDVDDDLVDQATRLIRSLDRLPLPPDVLEDRVKEMGAWTDLLLEGRGEDDQAGPAPVSTLLEDRIVRLRSMVDTGVAP